LQCVRTDADSNADVALRPCFRNAVRVLGYLRAGFPFYAPAPPNAVSESEIAPALMDAMEAEWKVLTGERFLPEGRQAVTWRETRLSGAQGQNPLAAKWVGNGREIVVNGGAGHSFLRATLRFSGNERVTFAVLPKAQTISYTPQTWPQDVVDKPRLLDILTTYFHFPFENTEDFFILGNGNVVEGVRVFGGSVHSKEAWAGTPAAERRKVSEFRWYDDEVRLFITDSDPQYFCVTVDTRPADRQGTGPAKPQTEE
jgi:hypothetical protein